MTTDTSVQEELFEYFKDTPNKLLVEFIKSFVYNQPTQDTKVSKLVEKFLKDNGLELAFCNYYLDLTEPTKFFKRINGSEVELINEVKHGLLSLAFNRLNQIV